MPHPADGPALTYQFGEFELDLGRKELRGNGARLQLQRKPLQLLLYLARNRDRVVSKEELLDQVWPDVVVSENALTSALRDLRKALGDEGRSPRFIENLRGHGYRFIAQVEERGSAQPERLEVASMTPVAGGASRRLGRTWVAIGLAMLIGGTGAAAWTLFSASSNDLQSEILARPAIAVLPFDNLSGDPDQEYFADGITEDLITRLSRWRSFPVIARNSSFVYKGRAVDVKQVGEELGARYVVEGSVRRADRRLRITAKLIDASTGHLVWAEHYDRDLMDTLLVQDEITEAIVGSMHPELLRFERQRASRGDPDRLAVWDLVQRGYWHFYRYNREDNAKALALFQRAAKLDPYFARAFVGQSQAHDREYQHAWTDARGEALRRSLEAARRAVEFDPADPWAHRQLGVALAFGGDNRGYGAALRRAIELDPSGADFQIQYAMSQVASNANEAITSAEKGLRLSPRDPALQHVGLIVLGAAHLQAHRYEEAIGHLRRGIESSPTGPTGGFVRFGLLHLAAAYAHQGRLDEADKQLEKLYQREPDLSLEEVLTAFGANELDSLINGLRKAGVPES